MTKLVLPRMLDKRKGVIVNLSSCVSSIMPPMLTGYAATKVTEQSSLLLIIMSCVIINFVLFNVQSFVDSFSDGLYKEYTGKGIIVQVGCSFCSAYIACYNDRT